MVFPAPPRGDGGKDLHGFGDEAVELEGIFERKGGGEEQLIGEPSQMKGSTPPEGTENEPFPADPLHHPFCCQRGNAILRATVAPSRKGFNQEASWKFLPLEFRCQLRHYKSGHGFPPRLHFIIKHK